MECKSIELSYSEAKTEVLNSSYYADKEYCLYGDNCEGETCEICDIRIKEKKSLHKIKKLLKNWTNHKINYLI